MSETEELLIFFKALADANRLKIVGLLAKQPHTVEELAALLGLGASTVSHHLARLSEAGLVTATAQSYYNFYRLETGKIEKMATHLLATQTLPEMAGEVNTQALDKKAIDYDRKILHDYLQPDGRLKTIPSQRKKLMVILHHIVNDFQPGQRYSERQVNEMLSRYHPDTASLRRELISSGLMDRESSGQNYWRKEEVEAGETVP